MLSIATREQVEAAVCRYGLARASRELKRRGLVPPIAGGVGGYAATVLADSPVMYWPMNEAGTTFADATGNGHTMTYNAGTRGSLALNLDSGAASVQATGTSRIAQAAFSSAFPQAAPWTHEALIRITATATGSVNPRFVACASGNGLGSSMTGFSGTAAHGLVVTYLTVADYNPGSSFTFALNATYHIALTLSGTTLTAYANGASRTPTVTVGTPVATTASITIGAGTTSDQDPWLGYLSDVAVYNVALSPAQINNHYVASITNPADLTPQPGTLGEF